MGSRSSRLNPFAAAIVLGLFWGIWHLPAINFLGAAAPHGAYWVRFFLAFTLAMTAMRVLIAWLYVNTETVLLAQLMHVSSTGTLVIFSPPVSASQEAMWYAVYGCALWVIAGVVAARKGRGLQDWGRRLGVAERDNAKSQAARMRVEKSLGRNRGGLPEGTHLYSTAALPALPYGLLMAPLRGWRISRSRFSSWC